ncbi:hypothetical protein QKV95_gp068 [Poseidoniales virus YSH_150918]|uniref:DUF3987 domain-containing protein n=1 Tax=Poseidoniales virus YSH_150918 TaxID=3071324 RepID=A0A976UBI7_9CAUD|nr:hypothetical protein QKV95_gp068 [Yangshan Harbor Poseidoniales virus]UVF62542.1 hypothetical protein [Poseidoniales virus YSH_150918]
MNDYDDYDIEQDYVETVEKEVREFIHELPKVIQEFQKSAVDVSHYNEVPSAICYFLILGQVCKDFIQIPFGGGNHEDTRIHFCWIQTSGTGKSTLWNFVGPVAEKTFAKINEAQNHILHPYLTTEDGYQVQKKFDVTNVIDTSDAALIGFYKDIEERVEVEEGQYRREVNQKRFAGALEGSGIVHYDEFEYSGIFKASNTQEMIIPYLNTMMNSLTGESWIIRKQLKEYNNEEMECYGEKSLFGSSYPPNKLTDVMTSKGILQRMLCYIWEVPESIQHKMREKMISEVGTIREVNLPVDRFAEAFYKMYEAVRLQYISVERNPLRTVTFADNYHTALSYEYNLMRKFINNTNPVIREIAGNFTTRLTKILSKISVLCCVSQSLSLPSDKRFIVTGEHVRQASNITRQCYNTLVSWLEQRLKVEGKDNGSKNHYVKIKEMYVSMKKDNDNFVNKKLLIAKLMEKEKLSQATVYRWFTGVMESDWKQNIIQKTENKITLFKIKEEKI